MTGMKTIDDDLTHLTELSGSFRPGCGIVDQFWFKKAGIQKADEKIPAALSRSSSNPAHPGSDKE
jgi:hypothetical protein